MIQDHTELAPLFSTQEPIVKSEGHQMKESQQQSIRPRHKVRIRQRAGPRRHQNVSEESKSGASLDISSRRASVTRQANRRISQPSEIGSNEIADVARPKQSRIRMKRPSMFKVAQKGPDVRGRPRPSHSGRDSPVFKSIMKMRIRNRNRDVEDSSVEISEALTPDISKAVSTLRPRLASRRKASLTSQTSSFRKPEITTRRLALSTRRQTSDATESSSTSVTAASPVSSEAPITVSPAAHIIRYTLDSSEVTSELSTRPETEQTENLTPRAEKLVASMAIPSDIFRYLCGLKVITVLHFIYINFQSGDPHPDEAHQRGGDGPALAQFLRGVPAHIQTQEAQKAGKVHPGGHQSRQMRAEGTRDNNRL